MPIAAGLSVLRYRLYDVERIVAATVTWVLLTTILVATYAFVVWLGARAVPSGPVSPALAATVGAVAAAGLAFPLRRALQDQVDRRFNRRAYDARRVIGAALAAEDAGIDVEAVLRDALHDPALTVAYPGPDGCVGDGRRRLPTHVDVDRHGRVVARIGFDPDRTDAGTVRRAARPRRRRARQHPAPGRAGPAGRGDRGVPRPGWPAPSARERRRIERDLHDGAQQSLLALAFELQTAQLNGDPERMRQALADGRGRGPGRGARAPRPGERAAPGRAGRRRAAPRRSTTWPGTPPCRCGSRSTSGRLDPGTEFTAWSVIGEAVVNAQKHAAAARHRGRRAAPERRPAAAGARRRPRRRQPGRAGAARPARPGRGGPRTAHRHQRRRRHDGRGGAAVRVVIADDSGLLRDGLANLLTEAGVDVVGPGGRRRAAARHGRRARAGRRDRRHPDAADVHPRGRQGRARAPPAAARARASCCSPSPWRAATSPTWPGSTRAASATCSRTGSPT